MASDLEVESQLNSFKTGFPALDIVSAATVDKGIMRVDDKKILDALLNCWDEYLKDTSHTILKFVPASGAASRMFKDLFAFVDNGVETPFIQTFLKGLDKFAFADELKKRAQGKSNQELVRILLEDMQYGKLPKGLLLFHHYESENRTPALEHLVEGAMYAKNANNEVNLHFTISHEHKQLFEKHIAEHQCEYEKRYGVKLNVSFSEQKPSTDTIAANPDGTPFRNADGSLLFRPGGHGALIENLNEQDADIVFIKNIDNVVPDRLKEPTVLYKRLLAGVLVLYQKKAFELLKLAEEMKKESSIKQKAFKIVVENFLEDALGITLPEDSSLDVLLQKLNRPMRVCGMVKNEGEPGGGPFLVKNRKDGFVECQILESSQIADKSLMQKATHFNPVDLVCGLKNYKGEKFCLPQFVDKQTGFISQKSKDGKELQALELPGLWNGAMADWNTVFVEVPVETFNPVKTVNDLLRDQHQ